MTETYRQETIKQSREAAKLACDEAQKAKSRKARSEAWESYNFWMNKAAFLVSIGIQES